MADRTIVCDRCRGSGTLDVDDPEAPCQAEIIVGSETIGCFATRKHPGEPHMAILCDPCPACGGYDECLPACAIYDMEPRRDPDQHWWFWWDGDLALTRADEGAGQVWRDEYQPSSPWARPRTTTSGGGSSDG